MDRIKREVWLEMYYKRLVGGTKEPDDIVEWMRKYPEFSYMTLQKWIKQSEDEERRHRCITYEILSPKTRE